MQKSSDLVGDAFPGEEPQALENQAQIDNDWSGLSLPEEYKFVYAHGQLDVSPIHSHDEISQHLGVEDSYAGPIAVGYCHVDNGKATWEVNSNVSLQAMFKILKDYTKHVGWRWHGMTDIHGQPVNDDFAPKKSMYYRWNGEELELGQKKFAASLPFTIQGKTAYLPDMPNEIRSAFEEWAGDLGFKLAEYPGGGNMEDRMHKYDPNQQLEIYNNGGGDSNLVGQGQDEREPSGLWRCPSCEILFPNWHEYVKHRQSEEPWGDEPNEDGKFPEIGENATQDSHFTPQQPEIFQAKVLPLSHNLYVAYAHGDPVGVLQLKQGKLAKLQGQWGPCVQTFMRHGGQEPKDLLADPIPFIYDVDKDEIHAGQPGTRTADIPGQFVPGGIVEGTYEPGGKVLIHTTTNMPWTVRHFAELWYYSLPHYSIKSVSLVDGDGKNTKLASGNIGGYISSMVAADPTAHTAAQALMQAGGNVYAVGGAVRDALMGKEPKDIDLMVQGLPSGVVHDVLKALPGRVDLTGKDFGVYRYRNGGDDVEIALPRRERSTGEGHQDFDVQADHTMSAEEDLSRRDFTANAMAVNLRNGSLIDPFGGASDIGSGTLRSVNPAALKEDPLRVLRGVVAHAKHGLVPDDVTRSEMAANAASLIHLPQERIQAELDKLMAAKEPANGVRLAHETGVLQYVLPEVNNAFGFDQLNPHHNYDLGTHLLNVLDGVSKQSSDPDLRLAALMHDIGKPHSQWVDENGIGHYYRNDLGQGADHEDVGADMARARMQSLRYPNDRINRVHGIISGHMFPAFASAKGARKFLNKWGEHADDLMTLRHADMYGKGTDDYQDTKTPVDIMREHVNAVRQAGEPTERSALAINGRDLINMGLQPGPQFSQILENLMNAVVEDPALNNRESLLALARQMV